MNLPGMKAQTAWVKGGSASDTVEEEVKDVVVTVEVIVVVNKVEVLILSFDIESGVVLVLLCFGGVSLQRTVVPLFEVGKVSLGSQKVRSLNQLVAKLLIFHVLGDVETKYRKKKLRNELAQLSYILGMAKLS